MLKKMNLPNKITMLRIILVPIFIIFMALPTKWIWPGFVAFSVYFLASITDFIDGTVARKKGIITKFGKIMDPLADKLIVSAGFIMLAGLGVIPAWIACIIVFRDFFVTALRTFGNDKGSDVAAVLSGKLKTVFQLSAVIFGIFGVAYSSISLEPLTSIGAFLGAVNSDIISTFVNIFMSISMVGAVITTLWSLVDYFIKFRKDINVEE